MKYVIEVKRKRTSTTQGSAVVCVNGEEMFVCNDEIELVKDGEKYYGDMIGGWASLTPDETYIKAMLFHPYDGYYRCSEKFRIMLNRQIETKEVAV